MEAIDGGGIAHDEHHAGQHCSSGVVVLARINELVASRDYRRALMMILLLAGCRVKELATFTLTDLEDLHGRRIQIARHRQLLARADALPLGNRSRMGMVLKKYIETIPRHTFCDADAPAFASRRASAWGRTWS